MAIVMICSMFILPAAEAKANVCNHRPYVKGADHVDTWYETHPISGGGTCSYKVEVYIGYYFCSSSCGEFLYYDYIHKERHMNSKCPYYW